mmetsp:Transcript_20235/g.58664  ORF Transcript_20235/g.58664 Transcript_20235/m.58664 type:complete len:975 (-) Transcript_20235:97-3021(-)|eukprot:CAMPEP_0176064846 /NCGR_PEP_ID=MMETSP0120_2-20121206/32347_1 /TAXON_ID=160619 /ORGANISM="Kryptoperidinium foliaceum, Strain CCMP 1326" /LENGTH=974 /DNA_ID=CAMNT_0017398427 /DNA_START=70 /DNA_END=2994 /DNA_ORIENTATION=-
MTVGTLRLDATTGAMPHGGKEMPPSPAQSSAPLGTMGARNPAAAPDDIDFPAIMELMTSRYTGELVDRHVAAIRKVCKTCCNGFLLKHLEPLVELLELVVDRISKGIYAFAPAMCDMIRVASLPFVSCKASDMISYGHHLPEFIKVLVSVLNYSLPPTEEDAAALGGPEALEEHRAVCERVRIEVAHTLACWSRFGLDEDNVEVKPHQPLIQAIADSGTPNLRVLWQSEVMHALATSFRSEDSPEAIVITLGAIRDMSLYRPLARQITSSGLILNLVQVIRVNLLGSDVLLVAAEVLWNVLELDWEGGAEALGQEEVIECFRSFMEAVLTRGYRFKDKIFRNDMMVLLMYISKREENRPLFASTGLLALLLSSALGEPERKALEEAGVLPELLGEGNVGHASSVGRRGSHGKGGGGMVVLTCAQEDMEFRMLLWGTLARCCSSQACAEIAVKCGFVQFLLTTVLEAHDGTSEQRQWSQEQRRKVQLEALSALFQLVQYMPDAFQEADGCASVLQLLHLTRSREVQKKCLNLLQVAVRQGPEFAKELGELGAVGQLVELFADKDNPMNSRQLCASVLAGLCAENEDNRREFRKKDGVEAIRAEVIYRPDETTDNHLFYTLCVVDCVWSAIVGTRKNEVRFLDAGGLFALLDVLEVAPLLLKRQIIGCLADLMQYRKAAKLFGQWNSQVTMKGAVKILLELWHSEQEAARSTSQDGVIRDLERPLNPQNGPNALPEGEREGDDDRPDTASSDSSLRSGSRASARFRQAKNFADTAASHASMRSTRNSVGVGDALAASNPSAANTFGASIRSEAVDATVIDKQDSRAKIFAVLRCVGFECQEILTVGERQQMEVVRMYPTATELEAWIEVRENLEARSLKPIKADLRWMTESIAERREQASNVQIVQKKLADELRAEEKASLHRFYEDVRSRAPMRRASSAKDDGSTSRAETPGGLAGGGGVEGAADELDGFSSDGF